MDRGGKPADSDATGPTCPIDDDVDDAPSCSGTALIEECVQRRAAALVRALAALVDGGLLLPALPIAEELARLLAADPEPLVVAG